jgi:hypothetical protein
MSKKLTDADKKDFVERMKAEAIHNGNDIAILVEDNSDINFWQNVFARFLPTKKLDFPYRSKANGKGEILQYKNYVDAMLIICRDSDNEYLYKEDTSFNVPFIYHTYVYSLENFVCHSKILNDICFELTEEQFNLLEILEKYSKIVYRILIYWIYCNKDNIKTLRPFLAWNDWTSCEIKQVLSLEHDMKIPSVNLGNISDFEALENRVKDFLQKMRNQIESENWLDSFDTHLREIETLLEQTYSISQDRSLFYLNGHIIYNYVIFPLMDKIIIFLKEENIEIMKKKNIAEQEISAYKNRTNKDLETLLRSSYQYLFWKHECEFMEKIRKSIERDFR